MLEYNIEIKNFNGVDADVCYPITKKENIIGLEEELNNKPSLKVYEITLKKGGWYLVPNYSNWFYNRVYIKDFSLLSYPTTFFFTESVFNTYPHSYFTSRSFYAKIYNNNYIEFRSYVQPGGDVILTLYLFYNEVSNG